MKYAVIFFAAIAFWCWFARTVLHLGMRGLL